MVDIIKSWFKRYFSDPEAVNLVVWLLFIAGFIMVVGNIAVPIVVSLVIAYLLGGFVRRLERMKVPHILAVIIVYLLFIGVFAVLFLWLLPLFIQQLASFIADIPNKLNKLQIYLIGLQHNYPEFFSAEQLKNLIIQFNQYITDFGKFILSFSLASIGNLLTIVIYVILVPLLVLFFLKDRGQIAGWLQRFLPTKHTAISKIWCEVDSKIGDYIRGKVIEIVLVAVVSGFAFLFMGLNYAILLGALVGLSVIVPYVGVILVTIPIVIVSLAQWGWSAHFAYLILIYTIICTLDANVLVPFLFSEAMALHPVVIILSVLIFGGLWGFWGVFFAIPLATLIDALLRGWPRAKKEK